MKLVQKLPMGLSLACVMFMSSCSKEDVQVAEPQVESQNNSSSLRSLDGISALPKFSGTIGATGLNIYPTDWQRKNTSIPDLLAFPSGTSSFTHMWGDPKLPWLQALPPLPTGQASGSVVTFTSSTNIERTDPYKGQIGGQSRVAAKIKYMKPGKKYEITMYAASTIPKVQQLHASRTVAYSNKIRIGLDLGAIAYGYEIHMTQNLWTAKTITFVAKGTEGEINFRAEAAKESEYVYANVFVDKNSIKEVQ
jgi:hypothetical protein